jgi:hypothetical protein
VLNGLSNYRYSGIDNGTNVHNLMAGIKTDALDTVKAAVLAIPAFHTNYPDVVTLYGDFIKQQKIESTSMNVPDARITHHHNGPASVTGSDYEASYDGVVEDRFYNHAEYRTLSSDQKNELRLKRKHRVGNDNGRSKGNDRRSNGKRFREDERKKDKNTIKSLTRTIAAFSCKTDDPESSSDEAYGASKASEPLAKSNRTNSSLTHQRGSIKLTGAGGVTSSMESLKVCAITMHLGSLGHTGPACRSDLDSHDNVSVVWMEVITFQDFELPVNVSVYEPKGPVAMDLKTVSAGMAYYVPGVGRVVILIVHQEINLPHLPHNLLNPMQMRMNDVVVNETPKFQCANPTNLYHTITVKGENMNDELDIPLYLRGVVSCFTTRKPT